MEDYSQQQWKIFSEELLKTFVKSGFEVIEKPYIDLGLGGFRATYVRHYQLKRPLPLYDNMLTTFVRVIGLPFGRQMHKMIIMSELRNVDQEPAADTMKLRVQYDQNGHLQVIHGENQHSSAADNNNNCCQSEAAQPVPSSSGSLKTNDVTSLSSAVDLFHNTAQNKACQEVCHKSDEDNDTNLKILSNELADYISHIIEAISPGLVLLPDEMKLEILKQLEVDSIIKISQLNHKFRSLIFHHGESLWRYLCWRDFKIKQINRFVHRNWLELYRDTYILQQYEICRKERALPGLPEILALPAAPYRLPIAWLPRALELPFHPIFAIEYPQDNQLDLALEILPLRRVDSLDSIH